MEQPKSALEQQRTLELEKLTNEYTALVKTIELFILEKQDSQIAYFEIYNDFGNRSVARPLKVQAVRVNSGECHLGLFHPTEKTGGYGYTISIDTEKEEELFSLDIGNLDKKSTLRNYNIPRLNQLLKELGFLSLLNLPDSDYFTSPVLD